MMSSAEPRHGELPTTQLVKALSALFSRTPLPQSGEICIRIELSLTHEVGKSGISFAGMSGFAPMEARAQELQDEGWVRYFNPTYFENIERVVSTGHARALTEIRSGVSPWRYSGGTDLVSFLCHAREPAWLSLVYCRIDIGSRSRTLGEVTEAFRVTVVDGG
jgi:hypothetical protein